MTTAFYTGGIRENGMLRWLTSGEEITREICLVDRVDGEWEKCA